MLKKILFTLIWASAYGNFAEFFAASTSSAALGGQGGPIAAANYNYYAPALIAYNRQIQFSFSTFQVSHYFKDIDNVLIRNCQNSSNGRCENDTIKENGPINTDYDDLTYGALHIILPIMRPEGLKLGFSLFAPLGKTLGIPKWRSFLNRICYVPFSLPKKCSVP